MTKLRVRYADTDAQGIVYNGAFFRFLEVARFEMVERLFSDEDSAVRFWERLAVRRLSILYETPLRFPERFTVFTSIVRVGSSSIGLAHRIVRDTTEEEIASSEAVLVHMDIDGATSQPLPQGVRDSLASWVGVLENHPEQEKGWESNA